MPRHIAFLRGINVGGHRVTMDRLRASFEALGLANVTTFIASGNVVFDTRSRDLAALERRIEARLEADLGYAVPTFVRTPAEVAATVAHRAFPAAELEAPGHTLHVAFVRGPFDVDAATRLAALDTDVDAFRAHGREFHWLCRGKITGTLVPAPRLQKAVGMPMTMRNVTALRKLLAAHPPA